MKLHATLIVGLLLVTSPVAAETAQQQKMKDCNAEATQKGLQGADRQTFMSTCLSGVNAQQKNENAQQKKMKTCNADANKRHLTGGDRTQFMRTCLKGS